MASNRGAEGGCCIHFHSPATHLYICIYSSPVVLSPLPPTSTGGRHTVEWIKRKDRPKLHPAWQQPLEAMASNRGATEAGREGDSGPVGADKFLETVLGVGSLKCFRHMLQPSDLGARATPRAPRRPPL